MAYALQLVKMAALAAIIGLLASHWLSVRDAVTVGLATLWLLTVRVS